MRLGEVVCRRINRGDAVANPDTGLINGRRDISFLVDLALLVDERRIAAAAFMLQENEKVHRCSLAEKFNHGRMDK